MTCICMCVHRPIHAYICIHAYPCVCSGRYMHTYVYMHTHVCVLVDTCIHMYILLHTCMHVWYAGPYMHTYVPRLSVRYWSHLMDTYIHTYVTCVECKNMQSKISHLELSKKESMYMYICILERKKCSQKYLVWLLRKWDSTIIHMYIYIYYIRHICWSKRDECNKNYAVYSRWKTCAVWTTFEKILCRLMFPSTLENISR